MNVNFLSRIPWLSLVALWLAFTLLGWYLSAHHIFWIVGACVATIVLAILWKSNYLFERLFEFSSQGLLLVLIMLALSVLFALAATWSILIPLVILPFITMFFVGIEMRSAGFSKVDRFYFIAIIAGLSIGLGELIDIVLLPSIRY